MTAPNCGHSNPHRTVTTIYMIKNKHTLAWAFYDWANSAFATVVIAGFFPIFFKEFWASELTTSDSTFQLGLANSVASLVIVIIAPLLGSLADQQQHKKRYLILFAMLGISMACALALVEQGAWGLAIAVYVLANIGFMGSNVFYDALIVDIAPPQKREMVSALGYALGYLGGGLIFALCVMTTLYPAIFGFADASDAVRFSFFLVGLWWALFSIPVMLFVHEAHDKTPPLTNKLLSGFIELKKTFHEIRQLKDTFLFLLAYWFYIDGVDTIIRMAVDYGLSIGFDANNLILALLITQFVGFPAALLFGKLGERYGARSGIFIAIAIYLGIIIWAYNIESSNEFYALAFAIGLVQGGIQSLSRSLFSVLIPKNRSAQFFGFYNMCGKSAAILGPFLMGWVSVWTNDPRYSILSIALLFIIGAGLLYKVNIKRGIQHALVSESK